jgi:hypothetical protein
MKPIPRTEIDDAADPLEDLVEGFLAPDGDSFTVLTEEAEDGDHA